jgi:hypothetical protein
MRYLNLKYQKIFNLGDFKVITLLAPPSSYGEGGRGVKSRIGIKLCYRIMLALIQATNLIKLHYELCFHVDVKLIMSANLPKSGIRQNRSIFTPVGVWAYCTIGYKKLAILATP